MRPYYQRHSLRFSCTRCGRCCTGGADYYVCFSQAEAKAACAHLGLTWKWFRHHYLRRLDEPGLVAADNAGACIFLDAAGQCRIYAVRPVQCRTYPFWPELVNTAAAWKQEACRCEGINRGDVVPPDTISSAVNACLEVPY